MAPSAPLGRRKRDLRRCAVPSHHIHPPYEPVHFASPLLSPRLSTFPPIHPLLFNPQPAVTVHATTTTNCTDVAAAVARSPLQWPQHAKVAIERVQRQYPDVPQQLVAFVAMSIQEARQSRLQDPSLDQLCAKASHLNVCSMPYSVPCFKATVSACKLSLDKAKIPAVKATGVQVANGLSNPLLHARLFLPWATGR